MNLNNTREILQFVKPYLPPNPIIIEAGGCDGTDTVQLASFWPQGRLYTFEPVPELFQKIREKTSCFRNVILNPMALGDYEGQALFYLSEWPFVPGEVSGSSSLLPPKKHLIYDTYTTFPGRIEIEVTTFDAWALKEGIKKVDFLWLDMQGYEINMLQVSEIAKTAEAIWIEVEFDELYEGQYLYKDVQTWMNANGFRLVATDFDKTTLENNVKFATDFDETTLKNDFNVQAFGNALFVKNH